MAEVYLVIDGERIDLVQNGKSRNGTYDKFKEPQEYVDMGPIESPLIVTVYRKPGWVPSQK